MADTNIHIGEMLARNSRVYPDEVALVERVAADRRRTEITWKEFHERANRFSHVLTDRGVKKGDKVAHWMQNSIDWLVAYFGIVLTGAWVVPLNFRFTAEEMKYCADVADPAAFVFDEEFADRVDAVRGSLEDGPQLHLCRGPTVPSFAESFQALMSAADSSPLNVGLTFADPCGLYFTSGTTGQPKPILLTHNNMANACIVENMHHRQTKDDVFILIPPLYHTGAKMHWCRSLRRGKQGRHTEGGNAGVDP